MVSVTSPHDGEIVWTAPEGAAMSRHHVVAWLRLQNGSAVQVFCTQPGVIQKMAVKVGDTVTAGAILCELGPPAPAPDESAALKKGLLPVVSAPC